MKKYILIPIFLVLFLACCDKQKPVEVAKKPVGKIVDARVVPTSFNEFGKTQIKTEFAFIVVYRYISVDFGAQAYIITCDNGRRYFTWDGTTLMYRVV